MNNNTLFINPLPESIHFIGICGVAMASVAVELHNAGFDVTGSDTGFYPPMGDFLKEQGVSTLKDFKPEHIPENGIVVVGNAISRGNVELEEALNRGIQLISLPELVQRRYITNRKSIVVTGTHGKTTTTSMIAHILEFNKLDPGWMIGGIPIDLPVPCSFGRGNTFVIEGDEYDSVYYDKRPKFLNYCPQYAVMNRVEFDHADIYQDLDAIKLQFTRFVRMIPENGFLAVYGDDAVNLSISEDALCKTATFGQSEDCDWKLIEEDSSGSKYNTARIISPQGKYYQLELLQPGEHNLLNALGALVVCRELNLTTENILEALREFHGVARRLELVLQTETTIIYDDFAHHPTAISTTLKGIRKRHPDHNIWAFVDPRSNTMVRNFFQNELLDALSFADHVLVGALHRKERIPVEKRLDRRRLVEKLRERTVIAEMFDTQQQLEEYVNHNCKGQKVLIMLSNGSFNGLKEFLSDMFSGKIQNKIKLNK